MALIDSYSEKLTFIVTFVLFLIPAMVLLFVFILGNRVAKAVALGVPGLLILAHLVTTVLFISTGGPQAEATTFDSAVHAASFVPKNITLERRLLPDLRLDQASGVKSTGLADELYISFATTSWPSPETRVVLKTSPDNLKKLAAAEKFTGVLRKAPLPYLVRSSWPQHPSVFAIILEDRATVRTMFIPAAVVYVFLLIWAAVTFFKSRRSRPAPQVAQI